MRHPLKTFSHARVSLLLEIWNIFFFLVLRFNKCIAVLADNRQVHNGYLKKENVT